MNAQDIQFSQFYAVPLYQNPAFAGSAHHVRGIAHQRLQWPALSSRYTTSLLSVDNYYEKQRSGVGLMVSRDWQGASTLNSWDIGALYAYELPLNDQLTFRSGIQASLVSRSINYADLRFPRDFTDNGYQGNSAPYGDNNVLYPDFSTGGVLYSNKWWFGLSAHHLSRPNQSFYDQVSRLPIKTAFTGGYKIPLVHKKYMAYIENEKDISITPTFHYKFQGKSDQLDLGIYGLYDQFIAGFWYRGIPIKKLESSLQNNESVIVLAGWKYQNFNFTYSYDFTISKLVSARTAGAHEINVTYIYVKHKKNKPMRRLPCPSFYKH